MPCGKRPVVKKWDKPKELRNIKRSRYEQNEASVKLHWRKVMKDLELLCKDDKFWDTQRTLVRDLVGEVIFERLTKIFDLPKDKLTYEPPEEDVDVEPSDTFYIVLQPEDDTEVVVAAASVTEPPPQSLLSDDFSEEVEEEEQSEELSASSIEAGASHKSLHKSNRSMTGKSNMNVEFSKISRQWLSQEFSKTSTQYKSKSKTIFSSTSDDDTSYDDDIKVHADSLGDKKRGTRINHHFELLYCNESETDMIKWNSNYKQKKFDVSASDEFSKKAQIVAKEISHKFYEWWISVGSSDYKSEIKRPEDIEDLFQVWFDEHASRGLVVHPKIMPCVLESIAKAVGVPKAACSRVLQRQIAFDIHAETSPQHTRAFNTSLPRKMRHIPPRNNTKEQWRDVQIPEDLRTMSCVFAETVHLTSTKSFREWLQKRPHLVMPEYFRTLDTALRDKKQLFVVPSDFFYRGSLDAISSQSFNLPVSQFDLDAKDVLSKLLRD